MRPLTTRNDGLFEQLSTYVVTTRPNRRGLELSPFGVDTRWIIDPQRLSSAVFLELLQVLDGLTFGPEGMPMDKWVFYNCAELPGFIYGFATEAAAMTATEREMMRVPMSYEGPVPFSMYIAIPMHERGWWFGHNLASLNRTFPHRGLQGMGTITKAVALKAYRVERFFGATQWMSKALYIHTRFGPLELHTAYTPAHSLPETLTYGFDVDDDVIRYAAGDPDVTVHYPEPDMRLDGSDAVAMQTMQARIEAGERFDLVGPPSTVGGTVVHPIRSMGRPLATPGDGTAVG